MQFPGEKVPQGDLDNGTADGFPAETTSTNQPVTSAPAVSVQCAIANPGRLSPNEAATCLYAAWQEGDPTRAERYASPETVQLMFFAAWQSPGHTFQGCRPYGIDESRSSTEICEFSPVDDLVKPLKFRVSGTPSSGATVIDAAPDGTEFPFPPELEEFIHGGDVWVVVLAGAEGIDNPIIGEALAAAEDAGYRTSPDEGCDHGATEIAGVPDYYATVSVYLPSQTDALLAADAFAARGVSAAVGEIQTFCLD